MFIWLGTDMSLKAQLMDQDKQCKVLHHTKIMASLHPAQSLIVEPTLNVLYCTATFLTLPSVPGNVRQTFAI